MSQKGEERLDRAEGVRMVPSAYDKVFMDVKVSYTSPKITGRRVKEVDVFIHQPTFTPSFDFAQVKAPVYVSHRVIKNGRPKDEYIDRIRAGLEDAKLLGVPPIYFDEMLRVIWVRQMK